MDVIIKRNKALPLKYGSARSVQRGLEELGTGWVCDSVSGAHAELYVQDSNDDIVAKVGTALRMCW